MTPLDIFRVILHIPVGLIDGWFLGQGNTGNFGFVAIGLVLAYGFFKYELNEDRHEKDKAFKDIMGFLIGLALFGIALGVVGSVLYFI